MFVLVWIFWTICKKCSPITLPGLPFVLLILTTIMVFACTNASVKMKTKTNVWSVLLFCYILAKKKWPLKKNTALLMNITIMKVTMWFLHIWLVLTRFTIMFPLKKATTFSMQTTRWSLFKDSMTNSRLSPKVSHLLNMWLKNVQVGWTMILNLLFILRRKSIKLSF